MYIYILHLQAAEAAVISHVQTPNVNKRDQRMTTTHKVKGQMFLFWLLRGTQTHTYSIPHPAEGR